MNGFDLFDIVDLASKFGMFSLIFNEPQILCGPCLLCGLKLNEELKM